jgi:hypothetical protein
MFLLLDIARCPRCLGNCNCRGCRKIKGLEPTGYDLIRLMDPCFLPHFHPRNLTLVAKKSGADSVAVMLDSNVKMTGILPGKGRQIPDDPNRRKVPKPPKVPNPGSQMTAPKPRLPVSRKPNLSRRCFGLPYPFRRHLHLTGHYRALRSENLFSDSERYSTCRAHT